MWKRIAVLVMFGLLPVSAVAHTRLFYRMSCKSDYRKVEVVEVAMVTQEPIEIPTVEPSVEIPLESTLTPQSTELPTPTLTPIPSDAPTEVPTPTPEVVETSEQITTPSDMTTDLQDIV